MVGILGAPTLLLPLPLGNFDHSSKNNRESLDEVVDPMGHEILGHGEHGFESPWKKKVKHYRQGRPKDLIVLGDPLGRYAEFR